MDIKIARLQINLAHLGYSPGDADGLDGGHTSSAIAAFRSARGMPAGGIDSALYDMVDSALAEERAKVPVLSRDTVVGMFTHYSSTATTKYLTDAKLAGLNDAMKAGCLNTRDRISHFIGQVFHESGGLRYFKELSSGTQYNGRTDLGNTEPGDGPRYKGRGPLQLTGRANYHTYGLLLGKDLEENPEQAADPDTGFLIAITYWATHNLNAIADTSPQGSDRAFQAITRAVNGGTNGLEDRRRWLTASWMTLTEQSIVS